MECILWILSTIHLNDSFNVLNTHKENFVDIAVIIFKYTFNSKFNCNFIYLVKWKFLSVVGENSTIIETNPFHSLIQHKSEWFYKTNNGKKEKKGFYTQF